MPERQILRSSRRANRIRLHESEPTQRTFQRRGGKEATGDGELTELVETDGHVALFTFMRAVWNRPTYLLAVVVAASTLVTTAVARQTGVDALRKALTFHASFDGKTDAAYAAGDPKLYWAPSSKQRADAKPGLPESGEVQLASGAGRFGDALRFTAKKSPVVFFRAARNMSYETTNWSGTVSFWLSTDPRGELETGFCDPVQITPRAWNDAAFFVEFEKGPEAIPFRLGVYADLNVWNPDKRRFADIPTHERPLVAVDNPPFARGTWTHVVFTFERFNTGKADGVARLYLDGTLRGTLSPRQQSFTWDPESTVVGLGLSYIGMLDELSIFNRLLNDTEVRALYSLEKGVSSLH
jgi:Concanavalin A-like lectin/glucanases superfamily